MPRMDDVLSLQCRADFFMPHSRMGRVLFDGAQRLQTHLPHLRQWCLWSNGIHGADDADGDDVMMTMNVMTM
eukprot:10430295-Karenia_brevis.AAC.1